LAIDPGANAAYYAANNVPFAVGQTVWISRIEFRVVEVEPPSGLLPNGQLILAPVASKV
jgi:hypothetical protein